MTDPLIEPALQSKARTSLPTDDAPETVRKVFRTLLARNSEEATTYLYELGTASGYIDRQTLARNICWTSEEAYGVLECTINLAKPEKDPRSIAQAARSEKPRSASPASPGQPPLCDLCWENEGYAGSPEHPAKPGLRIAPITLGGEPWGLQYSPYAYFTEHCIALSRDHRPMKIDASAFDRLLDFVDAFPFYFIGSNADLPVVGGSILAHDHFQGGRHTFPLMKAGIRGEFGLADFPDVRFAIVDWPASTIRLASDDRKQLAHAAERVLAVWRDFSNEACGIAAFSGPTPHNTLNPIVRKTGPTYRMELVLRNNRTDAEHPWGIFHPAEHLHHIKKENIGLIEIMGLAVLPPRLASELPAVQKELVDAARRNLATRDLENRLLAQSLTSSHATWAADIYTRRQEELLSCEGPYPRGNEKESADRSRVLASPHPASSTQPDRIPSETPEPTRGEPSGFGLHPIIKQEVAHVFTTILETTGVFKQTAQGDAGWDSLIEALGKTHREQQKPTS